MIWRRKRKARAELIRALDALRAELERQNDYAWNVRAEDNAQLTGALAEIVGRGIAGRNFKPGSGPEVSY